MFSVEYRNKEDWEDRLLTVPVITVDDMDVAVAELSELGGEVKGDPFELPIVAEGLEEYRKVMLSKGMHESQITDRIGVMQRMLDPAGNQLVLLQLDPHSQYAFRTGPFAIGMSHDQVTFWDYEISMTKNLPLGDGPAPENDHAPAK